MVNQVYVQHMLLPLWIIMVKVIGTSIPLCRVCVHLQATTSSDLQTLYISVDVDLDQWSYVNTL
jgi:hypothetical protein